MDNINRTLYIPLYGKAYVSKKGILLHDPKAEEIWRAEGFALKGKSASKWLAYYMGMRSAVFDRWLQEKCETLPDAVILHIGCGMDSRICRVASGRQQWYDIDFPEVIAQRRRYYPETTTYHMVPADIREPEWLHTIPGNGAAIVVMEGVSMYLKPEELAELLKRLQSHFGQVHLLMDCYSEFSARASKYKNPIRDVGVTEVYGLDDTSHFAIPFREELEITPAYLIDQLQGMEKWIFRLIYAGSFAGSLYRLYAFST